MLSITVGVMIPDSRVLREQSRKERLTTLFRIENTHARPTLFSSNASHLDRRIDVAGFSSPNFHTKTQLQCRAEHKTNPNSRLDVTCRPIL